MTEQTEQIVPIKNSEGAVMEKDGARRAFPDKGTVEAAASAGWGIVLPAEEPDPVTESDEQEASTSTYYTLDKDALLSWTLEKYNLDLDGRKTLENLQKEVDAYILEDPLNRM